MTAVIAHFGKKLKKVVFLDRLGFDGVWGNSLYWCSWLHWFMKVRNKSLVTCDFQFFLAAKCILALACFKAGQKKPWESETYQLISPPFDKTVKTIFLTVSYVSLSQEWWEFLKFEDYDASSPGVEEGEINGNHEYKVYNLVGRTQSLARSALSRVAWAGRAPSILCRSFCDVFDDSWGIQNEMHD